MLTHSLQSTSVREFLLLRLTRIYPAYWVAAAVFIVVRWRLGQPTPLNAALVKGLLLVPAGPGRATYALGVEWSLVYEMFFYFALSLFALAGPRRGILFGTLTWFGLCLVRILFQPSYAWLQFPTWAQIALSPVNTAFLCGVIAYYVRHHVKPLRLWAAVLVPALIAASYLTPRVDLVILAQGIGGGLLVAWAAATTPAASDHPLVRYGDFSYGVYLIHVPLLTLLFAQGAARALVRAAVDGRNGRRRGHARGPGCCTAARRRRPTAGCAPASEAAAPGNAEDDAGPDHPAGQGGVADRPRPG